MKVICLKNYSKSLKIILKVKTTLKYFFRKTYWISLRTVRVLWSFRDNPCPPSGPPSSAWWQLHSATCGQEIRVPFPISSQLGGIRKSRPLTWTASPSAPRCRNWIPSKATQRPGTLSLYSYSSDRRSIPCTAGQEYCNRDRMCPSLLVGQRFCAWETS